MQKQIEIAPMLDWTDTFFRQFFRLISHHMPLYTEMMAEARKIATDRMVKEAEVLGADAIVGVKYGSSAVMQGAAEIIVYGTAVTLM